MPYKDTLKIITGRVEGGLAALIMGYDGIAIDEYLVESSKFDLQLLSVEYSNLLKDIRKTVELLGTGSMEEVAIVTDLLRVIIRVINEQFFLVLVMTADGNYGKGRYLIQREAINLKSDLV